MEDKQIDMLEFDERIKERKRRILEKKVNLLLEELELQKDEEQQYKLTTEEQEKRQNLSLLFHTQHPVNRIQNAIDNEEKLKKIRKDFLNASIEYKEKEGKLNKLESESDGILLLATGIPLIIIGYIISDTFKLAGIVVMLTGAFMHIPLFVNELLKKRKAKKEYKKAECGLNELSKEISSKSSYIDNVCDEYKLPVNTIDKTQSLYPILDAAKQYEELEQKETDYRLLVRLNNSSPIKQELASLLGTLAEQEVVGKSIEKNMIEDNLTEKGEMEKNGRYN